MMAVFRVTISPLNPDDRSDFHHCLILEGDEIMFLTHGLLLNVISENAFDAGRLVQNLSIWINDCGQAVACRLSNSLIHQLTRNVSLEAVCSSVEMTASIWLMRVRCAGMRLIDNTQSTRFRQYDKDSP